MKEKIRIFLDSDLLERYLMDTITSEESLQVEHYIALYPEVRETYMELQENLEVFAKMHAVKTPNGLREQIMHRIKLEQKGRKRFTRLAIAASFAVMISAGASFFFYNQNRHLQSENALVNNKIKNLEADMHDQLEDVRNQFIVLNNPNTRKYSVNGNKNAKDLKAVAYINPIKKLSYINVRNLPDLPEDQCYQMWAEVNGEMMNLGVINKVVNKDKLFALPYSEKAVGYITIEPQGGNAAPTVENIVANYAY